MSDVLFVVPSQEPVIFEECEGTVLLATILRESGIDTEIYRFYEADMSKSFNEFVNETVENICSRNPRIISFYCRCDCFLADIRIAQALKSKNKDFVIVFGGPQATASCRETIEELPFVDYCCSGEGETTVVPFFGGLLKGEDITRIAGLTYRNDEGQVVSNPAPQLIKDLDTIPYIDYDLVPAEVLENTRVKNDAFAIDVGRGCPFNCAYCSTKLFWNRKFRLKSTGRIVAEMQRINNKYGINKFVFEHDLFTANKKNVLNFCRELLDSGLGAKWVCSSRIDTIDEEMIDAMADAGCRRIFFGIETGSPRMQEIIHKKIDIDDVIRICKHLVKKDVKVTASFIYGFPEETEEDLEQTLRLVQKLIKIGIDVFQFHLCAILPGTEYYEKYRSKLVFAKKISNIVSDFGVKENYDFICEHKNLFSFYYEYQTEHADRFEGIEKVILEVMALYNACMSIDSQKFSRIPLTQMCLAYRDANKDLLDRGASAKECAKEFAVNFFSAVYEGEDANKACQIYEYMEDCRRVSAMPEGAMDIKMYSADIKAYTEKKPFDEIAAAPTMVYFKKNKGKVENIINKM